jgi:hypothetical protein
MRRNMNDLKIGQWLGFESRFSGVCSQQEPLFSEHLTGSNDFVTSIGQTSKPATDQVEGVNGNSG